ncbi:MAG: AAA family ATPase [Parcubacteria group bacterium]|nr:AAA family ATPase [Parcubacteria group bacterium]
MITKIVIENFKKFEKAKIDLGLSPILFVGQNNGGKTTALQAISLWSFFIRRWQTEKAGSKATIRAGLPVARSTISAVPTRDIRTIWRNGEVQDKKSKKIKIVITAYGRDAAGVEWNYGVESTYQNKELLHCKPIDIKANVPAEATRVFHLPPLSGVQTSEKKIDEAAQQQAIGEGRPGEILRNLLLYVQTQSLESWKELKIKAKDLFQIELQDIQYVSTIDPSIVVEYLPVLPDKLRMKFEIANAGSGFLQFLLLAAFMYAHKDGAILLIDEPDSHMHTFLQRHAYDWLQEIANKTNSQLIISTHSEVLVNSTSNIEQIVTFFGQQPKKLNYDKRRLTEVLKEVSPLSIINAEWQKKIFFAEGDTDLRILKSFARILNHRVYQKLDSSSFFFRPYKTNDISDAMSYFQSLQKIIQPELKGFCLRDFVLQAGKTQKLPANFQVEYWVRKEIENYLIHPKALLRFIESKGRTGLFSNSADQYLKDQLPPAVYRDPLKENIDGNGSDFLEKFFSTIKLNVNKGNYWEISEVMLPEEVHSDIKYMLNKLDVFLS